VTTQPSLLDRLFRFCLEQKIIVLLLAAVVMVWGLIVAPFDFDIEGLPREPVPVDAIPDTGENQQIVFTPWDGRSPQDIDDQISYPLTVALMGLPGVKSVRSYSILDFSSVYVIFDDDVDFYFSRTRILEKLASLPAGVLPEGVSPVLGPDATALGQVFWYTLEGRDEAGQPTGGWDLNELRSIQDWNVRYALMSADGVAEVASIGGFVREYQVDVDPDAMRGHGVTLEQIIAAVRQSNLDVGARTIEVNSVEYIVRGVGFVKSVEDLESIAVTSRAGVPVTVSDVAHITVGPALRRGALDKGGAEAVGGVVVVRYGENPMQVIKNVKARIAEIQAGLPRKTLPDGRISHVTVVPFYDRSGLINETLGTLRSALTQQVLVTIVVIVLLLTHLRSSILVSAMLPLAVLMTFVGMKSFGVDANIVALSGIAIAVGTIVDMGIVLCENILRRLDEATPDADRVEVIASAAGEVGGAVLTAVLTTVVSFLPVFTMEAAEGKLFKPLAYTKTFALIASIIIALTLLPALAHLVLARPSRGHIPRLIAAGGLGMLGAACYVAGFSVVAAVLIVLAAGWAIGGVVPPPVARAGRWVLYIAVALFVLVQLTTAWEPLGPERGLARNLTFVGGLIGSLLIFMFIFQFLYPRLLALALRFKLVVLVPVVCLVVVGFTVWLGFNRVFAWLPESVRSQPWAVEIAHAVPGLGREFMPALDEGSFLYMPTTMFHASIGEAMDALQKLDMAIAAVPEVDQVVGKIGRVESALDPAPISMVETVITYHPEYVQDASGRRLRFAHDGERFLRGEHGQLIPDDDGKPFRTWRDHIESPDDIWAEIVEAAEIPGVTSAPKLQPIETRRIMLQSGFRAPMGVKVYGPDLETIESFALELERLLKEVPGVEPAAVFADRIVGKPYLEIHVDRERIARYGMSIERVQNTIETAVGGRTVTRTVEGRERYPVRVRYQRERRDSIDALERVYVGAADGQQIPLAQLADIRYVRGPQMIKSEDTFLVGYVLFDKKRGIAEVDAVEQARSLVQSHVDEGALIVPEGVSFEFAGAYENQVRAARKLRIVLPLSLAVIFIILYVQFRSVGSSLIVFTGVFIAWSGGFCMLWLYGRDGFLDFDVFGQNMRDLFHIGPVNLSVAVWVGFLALFGIATDDGVVLATRLRQVFARSAPDSIESIRAATIEAGRLRVRACVTTTATTVLALLPVLTSDGRGADIMGPMAIPTFGGMVVALLTLFVVPILYCAAAEWRLRLTGLLKPHEGAIT
jgi:Cu(I)/Ag(I) efflux system membrane protein CusA/SilA